VFSVFATNLIQLRIRTTQHSPADDMRDPIAPKDIINSPNTKDTAGPVLWLLVAAKTGLPVAMVSADVKPARVPDDSILAVLVPPVVVDVAADEDVVVVVEFKLGEAKVLVELAPSSVILPTACVVREIVVAGTVVPSKGMVVPAWVVAASVVVVQFSVARDFVVTAEVVIA